ncbi:MAG: discoidin domain-containing protein, partial [Planctomycetes bacterium]|nr:discoidin domain-containing protein [Planctomycetota bacterium]
LTSGAEPSIDLDGDWAFQLDPRDEGIQEQFFNRKLEGRLRLPGSLQEQGFGNEVSAETPWIGDIADRSWFTDPRYEPYRRPGQVKVPFWLQPEKHYAGAAWYQKEVMVPESWRGRRVTLFLERPHWETRLWADGREIGRQDSLSTPHVYDLSDPLSPGTRRLTLRVDNRMIVPVGVNSHSVSDQTQSSWNGIAGRLRLAAGEPVWIDDVQVFPDPDRKRARVQIVIGHQTGKPGRGELALSGRSGEYQAPEQKAPVSWEAGGGRTEVDYALGEGAPLWDEFQPAVIRLAVRLTVEKEGGSDLKETSFGLRDFKAAGTQFTVNGRKIFLRGTVECCVFPLTGYPPTDHTNWKRIIGIAKEHGLNHMRFHSWCPPEAAFAAADELGFYFQVECASWANQGASIGEGRPVDRWLYEEGERIVKAYGNHPSFALMAYGNEPAGPGNGAVFLKKWVEYWKAMDPRRLYTSGAGWPAIPENQYHNLPDARIQAWGAGLRSRINARPPETVTDYRDHVARAGRPLVNHEIGEWCVYPNFEEIPKYKGVLKAKNFEIFRDFLKAHHMGNQARDFLMASGKLQAACYKEEVESALRTPGLAGFQLLQLNDFPGQGTALVGVLDPFWDSKGYISAAEFRRFCGRTVPLARLAKRLWTSAETFQAEIEVAHFGPEPLESARASWKMVAGGGRPLASGELPAKTISVDNGVALGRVEANLASFPAPAKYRLAVRLSGAEVENDWEIWVYPPAKAFEGRLESLEVTISETLGAEALSRLQAGGKVLLLAGLERIRTGVQIGFSSVFWNTSWTGNQPPHTLGLLLNPRHPAFADFPTEFHSNWQWWELVSRSAAMVLDGLPPGLRPLVQPIDTWFENRRLGLLFEARAGGGKLLVSSMDLSNDLEARSAARQLRYGLIRYMESGDFDPRLEVNVDQIKALLKEPPPPPWLKHLGAAIAADSAAEGFPAANAIDGDPETLWHTPWEPQPSPMPHHLIIDLQKTARVAGLRYLPRQDMANGRIAAYELSASEDGERWSPPLASGRWPDLAEWQEVKLEKPVEARYLKLEAKSEVNGNAFASAAELDLIPAE